MQNAKVLNEKEVKEALAKVYNVPVENIMKLKYSFVIIEKEEDGNGNKSDLHD